MPSNQLTGIAKPPSPFRRVDVPTPQQQQQQQAAQRKSTSGLPQHFRPQPPTEQIFTPPSTTHWTPPAQNPTNDLNTRPGLGSMSR